MIQTTTHACFVPFIIPYELKKRHSHSPMETSWPIKIIDRFIYQWEYQREIPKANCSVRLNMRLYLKKLVQKRRIREYDLFVKEKWSISSFICSGSKEAGEREKGKHINWFILLNFMNISIGAQTTWTKCLKHVTINMVLYYNEIVKVTLFITIQTPSSSYDWANSGEIGSDIQRNWVHNLSSQWSWS